MNEVRRVVRLAAWRLWFLDVLRTMSITLTGALVLVLIARIVERVLGLSARFAPYWLPAALGIAGVAVFTSLLWATLRRRRALGVAVELDERAGLRESLSTAMSISKNDDPWSRVMIDTAELKAKGVKVRQAIPMQAPAFWPVPVACAVALLLVWFFFPNLDLLGATAKQVAATEKQREIVAVKADVKTKEQKLKEMLKNAKVEFMDEPTDAASLDKKPDINDPDAIRRAAVKNLTDLTAKIEVAKSGEKAAQAEAIKEAMRQLKQPGPGPLDEFTKSLAKGDFNKAQEQLGELSKQMADNSMSPDKKEQLKSQMDNLSKQLEKLGEDQKSIEKKLEQSGLDRKTAQELAKAASTNPEDMKKALEQLKNMTPEQKKQLLEMAKAAMKSNSECKSMGKAMAKMGQGMTQSGLEQEGMEAMQELSKELSDSEMLESDMQNLDAALDEAKKQMSSLGEGLGGDCKGGGNCDKEGGQGHGQWREGNANRKGSGSGGPGQSSGGASPEAEAADFTTQKEKANGKTGQGPIIGSRLVYGQQVKGEAVAQFSEGVAAGTQEAAEAMDQMQIPREYHDAVKHYFGTLADKVKKDKPASTTPPAPSAKDAPPK